jgi:hypothetical protein
VPRFRFSIANLLGAILFVGMGFAALLESTDAGDSAVLGLTLVALLTAVLLAVHRTASRQAFWMGFALFGWAYLVASLMPTVVPRLPTANALTYLDSVVARRPTAGVYVISNLVNGVEFIPLEPATLRRPSRTTDNFIRIGHSLIALVLAWLGGHLSRCLFVWNRKADRGDGSGASRAGGEEALGR